jgi:hypothetical protein
MLFVNDKSQTIMKVMQVDNVHKRDNSILQINGVLFSLWWLLSQK